MDKQLRKKKTMEDYCNIWSQQWNYSRWKESTLFAMEEWLAMLTDFAEIDKLTFLIKEKKLFIFIANWIAFMDFLHENEKKMNYGFND